MAVADVLSDGPATESEDAPGALAETAPKMVFLLVTNDQSQTGAHAAAPTADPLDAPAANGPAPIPALPEAVAETVFEILVAVMWSDGELISSEVERGRAAAEIMNARTKRGGALGAIADGPLPFPGIAFEELDAYARQLAYAAACWIDDASDEPSGRRNAFVAALRMKLDLSDEIVERLRAVATAVGIEFDDPRQAFAALMARVD